MWTWILYIAVIAFTLGVGYYYYYLIKRRWLTRWMNVALLLVLILCFYVINQSTRRMFPNMPKLIWRNLPVRPGR
ncbi:hypothetical protein [Spirosoma knui]